MIVNPYLLAAALILPALVLVGAAVSDLRHYLIPNRLIVALAALFLPFAAVGMDPQSIGIHLAVAIAALTLGMALFAVDAIGGSDAKLLAATALWAGVDHLAPFLIATALAGLVVSLVTLTFARRARDRLIAAVGARSIPASSPARRIVIPYGIAIASGGLVVLALIASSLVR